MKRKLEDTEGEARGPDLELLVEQMPHAVWLQVSPNGTDPDDDDAAIATVKLDYYKGTLTLLAWRQGEVGGDPSIRHVLWQGSTTVEVEKQDNH